ncbi:MAG: tyrosine recombinase XerC [Roseiflexaceae bacterium]
MTTDLIAAYLEHLAHQPTARGRTASPATVRAQRADLAGFAAWWLQAHALAAFDLGLVQERDLRDWQTHRQVEDGAAVATINRACASLRAFFGWAHAGGHLRHNPAAQLRDLPAEDQAPPHLAPEAVPWLFRATNTIDDPMRRARDRTILTLLANCGLRSQEAVDVQLRDLDLAGGTLTVRAGKGGKVRRLPLDSESLRQLREYVQQRCLGGLPVAGSGQEREQLLVAFHRTGGAGRWEPGMSTAAVRKGLDELGEAAATLVEEQARKTSSLARTGELEGLARQLRAVSPHQLRHWLGYQLRARGVDLGVVQRLLGHSRPATTLRYGQPTEADLREALRRANGG